jgi:hypothetical protein
MYIVQFSSSMLEKRFLCSPVKPSLSLYCLAMRKRVSSRNLRPEWREREITAAWEKARERGGRHAIPKEGHVMTLRPVK